MPKASKQELGVSHYYLRTKDGNHPFGVVAILRSPTDPTKVIRGISLRSVADEWNAAEGVRRAVGRVRKALALQKTTEEIIVNLEHLSVTRFNEEFRHNFASVPDNPAAENPYFFKSVFNGDPTEKEQWILEHFQPLTPKPEAPTLGGGVVST